MNQLPVEKRAKILMSLLTNSSLRDASLIHDVSINTVMSLLCQVGECCQNFHDIHMQGLYSESISFDEWFSFVYSRAKNTPDEKKRYCRY